MQNAASGFSVIFSRKDSRWVTFVSTLVFLFLLLLVQNGTAAKDVMAFEVIPYFERLWLAFRTLFDVTSTFTLSSLLLSGLGSLLGGINISLAYTYIRIRGEVIVRSGLYSGLGLFFAFIGIGCAACGTAFASVILSFFGLSAMLGALPYQGQEIGYIGIIFLCIATYTLSKKVASPTTC